MQILIPMSGRGSRFAAQGYQSIKPLIDVEGRPMIEHVVQMFPRESSFIFVCATDHLETTPLREVLNRIAPGHTLIAVKPEKKGPVWACRYAFEAVRDHEPVIVNYCDFYAQWNFADFERWIRAQGYDGALTAYRGFHPHSLGPNLYAYLRHKGECLTEIREKGAFTADRLQEFASSGTYYFKRGELMKKYFQQAIAEDQQTNGEYYASLPYNLMVRDGGKVGIFELEKFLQWGTPEDLEEYLSWSEYFRNKSDWKATRLFRGTTLLPMAGEGVRFQKKGYTEPKPLVKVDGTPMISRVLATLPRTEQTLLACRDTLSQNISLRSSINQARENVSYFPLSTATRGQADTCLLAASKVPESEPLFVFSCDAGFTYDEKRLFDLLSDPGLDYVVWAFKNHPHANRNPKQYGWVETNSDGEIKRIVCKEALSTTPKNDWGIIGGFWFRSAKRFYAEVQAMIAANETINGEFYVDMITSRMARAGLRGKVFPVENFICFGTPDDVLTYEYWADYFRQRASEPVAPQKRGAR